MAVNSNGKFHPLPEVIALHAHRNESHLARELRDRYSQDKLLGLLKDADQEARKAAAYALSLIGEPTAGIPIAALLHTEDATEHVVIEQSLWRLWFRSGRADVDALLHEGVRLMEQQNIDEAHACFDRVVEMAPDFPEGYNQRAIVYYLKNEWDRSIADCEQTVARNPVHFGALAGMGHCYLQQHQVEAALSAYERSLAINPHMSAIRRRVEELRNMLDGERFA